MKERTQHRASVDVLKFGGTSVRQLAQTAHIIGRHINHGERPLIVVSALGGITKKLREVYDLTGKDSDPNNNKARKALESIHKKHLTAAKRSGLTEAKTMVFDGSQPNEVTLQEALEQVHEESAELLTLGELPVQAQAVLLTGGEKRSNRLVTARLMKDGIAGAVSLDAEHVFETDGNYLEATILWDRSMAEGKKLLQPMIEEGLVPVITGFTGATTGGETTCLGTGSSDLAATAIARIMKADKVVIFTDVGGVYTDDPRKNPHATLITDLTLAEADEMAKSGHKVLHEKAMEPLLANGCNTVVYVRDTSRPSKHGTRITKAR